MALALAMNVSVLTRTWSPGWTPQHWRAICRAVVPFEQATAWFVVTTLAKSSSNFVT